MRVSGPRVAALAVTVGLVGYTFVLAPRLVHPDDPRVADAGVSGHHSKPPAIPEPELFPPSGKTFIGVTTKEGTYDFGPVDRFQTAIDCQPAVMMFNRGWIHDFDRTQFDQVARRRMLPMLNWEPWDYRDHTESSPGVPRQPRYRLSNIYGGYFDDYLRAYASGVKSLDYTIAIRFAHEMNGFWYPWGADVNGNRSGDYVKAWRHVRGIFTAAGATNVIWVWSPNIIFNRTQLAPFYPGDDLVDWIGLSGYYGIADSRDYRSPRLTFDRTIAHVRTFTKKPIVITETAATDSAGLKARWVDDFFRYLTRHPGIIGFIWYESVQELDWRIATAPEAARIFAEWADDPRFATPWSKQVVPRLTVDLPDPVDTEAPSPGPRPPAAQTTAAPKTAGTPTRSPTPARSPDPLPSPSSPSPSSPSPSPSTSTSPSPSPSESASEPGPRASGRDDPGGVQHVGR